MVNRRSDAMCYQVFFAAPLDELSRRSTRQRPNALPKRDQEPECESNGWTLRDESDD
jgi:hypothetical protein